MYFEDEVIKWYDGAMLLSFHSSFSLKLACQKILESWLKLCVIKKQYSRTGLLSTQWKLRSFGKVLVCLKGKLFLALLFNSASFNGFLRLNEPACSASLFCIFFIPPPLKGCLQSCSPLQTDCLLLWEVSLASCVTSLFFEKVLQAEHAAKGMC